MMKPRSFDEVTASSIWLVGDSPGSGGEVEQGCSRRAIIGAFLKVFEMFF